MRLTLIGADCRYSVEQLAITLFPEEHHAWDAPADPRGSACTRVSRGKRFLTAAVTLTRGSLTTRGTARVLPDSDPRREGALVRYAVRRAFYRAALPHLPEIPPWGALSGVRPAKLGRLLIRETGSPGNAVRALIKQDFVREDKARLTVRCAEEAVRIQSSRSPRDIDVYIGIPFCPTRCTYCSFVSSTVGAQGKLVEPYVDALTRELACGAERLREIGLRVRTLYMGGGTPTTLSASQLDRVLTAASALGDPYERTVEAGRPDTITPEKLAVLRAHGVGRISVNPQSMENHVLQAVGRPHTAEDIERAMRDVRAAGFDSVNMDLIAGLPADSPDGFARSLSRVLMLEPENVTVHTLALKRGADLHATPLPTEDIARMLEYAQERLSERYAPYYLYRQKYIGGSFENIGWTMPGHVCAYNVVMMEEIGTVLAFGAGAVTKLVTAEGAITRLTQPKYAWEYLERFEENLGRFERIAAFCAQPGSAASLS